MNEQKEISRDIKELVIQRLDIMPQDYKLSIGSEGTFTKDELIEHVKDNDSIGKQIISMELNFIRALTSGKFTQIINQNG